MSKKLIIKIKNAAKSLGEREERRIFTVELKMLQLYNGTWKILQNITSPRFHFV